MKVKEKKEIIQKIIKILSRSIKTDEDPHLSREPIGRSDTYWIRNTLQSMLDLGK